MSVDGGRIRQARKLHRLTQTKLAELAGVPQAALSRYESGEIAPPIEVVEKLAESTGFPVAFFTRPLGPEVAEGTLAFRARRYASTKLDIDQAHAWTELVYECGAELATRVQVPPVSLPRLAGEDPREAAQLARAALGLSPDRPIQNVTHTLERAGVFIVALPISLVGRDAFSTWAGLHQPVPLIVVPKNGSADIRFWVAHELKHLMDFVPRGYLKEVEDAADAFAAEFLTPAHVIREELRSPLSFELLNHLSRRWGVSRQSLVMRAVELGIVSARRGQQLHRHLRSHGSEPTGLVQPEKPRLLRKLAEVVYGNPPSAVKFAADFSMPVDLAEAMLDAHATRTEVVSVIAPDTAPPKNVVRFRRR